MTNTHMTMCPILSRSRCSSTCILRLVGPNETLAQSMNYSLRSLMIVVLQGAALCVWLLYWATRRGPWNIAPQVVWVAGTALIIWLLPRVSQYWRGKQARAYQIGRSFPRPFPPATE